MEVSFNECFEQTKIHRRDVIYADSDWFIIPNRAYAFHIHFIKELGKFSGNGRYRTGLIETADDGKMEDCPYGRGSKKATAVVPDAKIECGHCRRIYVREKDM